MTLTLTPSPRVRAAFRPLRVVALAYVVVIVAIMALAPLLAPADPLAQDIVNRMQPPGTHGHILGTDELGRDVLSRLMYGAQVELLIALGATLLAAVLGTVLGVLGAYFGGLTEVLTMRVVVDVILAFPPIILALLAVTIYGPGVSTLILAMGFLFAPTFARIAYGQTLTVKGLEYVDAAHVFGARNLVTLAKVILPNIVSPLIVQFSLTIAASILLESGLSYLGLGVVPPAPSWGAMVAQGQRYMATEPTALLIPATVVVVTILAFGLLGDMLRDYFDPKSRK